MLHLPAPLCLVWVGAAAAGDGWGSQDGWCSVCCAIIHSVTTKYTEDGGMTVNETHCKYQNIIFIWKNGVGDSSHLNAVIVL